MCGICGVVNTASEPVSLELLQRMARTMRHRGPDDEGYHIEGKMGLGFQRLSIIDLRGGHQPMSNEDDTLWIVFNGEIYNFQTLRQELEATGRHRFKTKSDTEMILHLYEEYGKECVQHLRGMFAFALWDKKNNGLFMARDRFGKKPLVYFQLKDGGLVFASELKALLRHPQCPREVDVNAVYHYLTLQYIPSPQTIFPGVFKLSPAHCLYWSEKEGLRTWRYWDLRYEPKESISYSEAKERLRYRFIESVKLRMIADVPLGAFLSGGIDSSLVVAAMAQNSSRPIKTFSIGFEEQNFTELPYAREVARRYQTDHHEFVVKPALVDVLPKLAWYYSEPFADSSALPSYYLAQQTRQHVTVALNGDGGDETFAGYLRYRAMWAMQFWNYLPRPWREASFRLSEKLPPTPAPYGWSWRIQRLLKVGALLPVEQYLRTLDYIHSEEQQELWQPERLSVFEKEHTHSLSLFRETLKRYSPKNWLDQLLYLDLNHYLPDCLMVKMDIASMANSLETRSPFLDHVLVEEIARWPARWKYLPLNSSKRILKDTFAKEMPKMIRSRGKQGFGIPISQWFRGPLKGYLRDVLLSPEALSRGYFRPETLHRFIDEHQSGIRDRSYGLWALLMLELWHQQFKWSQQK